MIITKTPLRISLLGGNTDFPKYFEKYGGAVLTMTIDKYVYCIIKERFDDQIWINYSIKEIVNDVNDIKHELVREAMKLTGVTKGIEITFLSDIPSQGSGLGSSSAVTIGVLNALHNYKGESVTKKQLTKEAIYIEIDILKKPIGYQDQIAIARGGGNKLEFSKLLTKYMPLTDHFEKMFKDSLMLFYTGKTRKTDNILSDIKLNKKILDKNKELVNLGMEAINHYDINKFGKLLDEYWDLKKKFNPKVTNRTIDNMYATAIYSGAIGGKIVGAGGGGFLLLVVPPEKKKAVRKALIGFKELPFNLSKYGSRVIFDINE